MSKFHTAWEVGPHGPVEDIDDGLISVSGEIVMPLGRFPRRMTVVRLADGGSLIWSAIALKEPDMAKVESFGAPRFMVVPNAGHRLDAHIYKARYPALKVIAPPSSRKAVQEAVTVDATEDIIGDPDVQFITVAGTDDAEGALIVRRASGVTLITNDIIGHVPHPHGLGANLMARLFDYGVHAPSITRTIRRYIDPITDDPKEVLLRLASRVCLESKAAG